MQWWEKQFCSPSIHHQNINFHGNTMVIIFYFTQTGNAFRQFSQIYIYTLQNQTSDFMNNSKREQLFDRDKLMMSCPEPSAGSPRPRAPSLNDRMSATAGPVFGEGTCQSSSWAAGDQVRRPINGGPSTAGSGPGSETPSGVRRSREWATETT